MPRPEETSAVRLAKGHLVKRLNNLSQKDWKTLCVQLGLWVPEGGGKGSHFAAYVKENCDRADVRNLVVTVQQHLFPQVQVKKFKCILAYGLRSQKYTEDDMWEKLGIK